MNGQGRLGNRIIMVTGGSRGIGLAIAEACAAEGAQLVLAAREQRALTSAAARLAGEPLAVAADVSRPGDVERLFRRVRRQFKRLDVVVASAGIFTFKPFARTTLVDWRRNIETNLTSLFLITRAAVPLLARSRTPHLINILSVASQQAFANCSAYSASKFGALGFTRVIAKELRPKRIRVTAVLPGPTNTRMVREFGFRVDRASLIQPEDVAEAVLHAILQPARTCIEELRLSPSRGAL